MSNNNKKYGLKKERELKKLLSKTAMEVVRSRGSFGTFDIVAFYSDCCKLISVKSVRTKYWSMKAELEQLKKTKVPCYCKKYLYIYWSPRADRNNKGWEVIEIDQ